MSKIEKCFLIQSEKALAVTQQKIDALLLNRKPLLNEEEYKKEEVYLNTKLGKKLLFYVLEEKERDGVTIKIKSIWSDEISSLEPYLETHDIIDNVISDLPRFALKT